MLYALSKGIIFTGAEKLSGKVLLLRDELIQEITDEASVPADAEWIDCSGCYIAPGLIDLQIYGGGGYLFSAAPSAEGLHAITDALVRSGTTGYLLTLATNSMDVFYEAVRVVKENPHPALLGLHLEGPYLNPDKRGAHIGKYIKEAELREIRDLLDYADGVVKMMTLAPELAGPGTIEELVNSGVIVSAGHSSATFQEACEAFKRGVKSCTHLFNAMSSFHHRDTGLPGAVFQSESVVASIIADGIHVDYNAVSISKRVMGDRLFLITDAVEESLNGPYVHVRQKDRYTLPDGTLSGSSLTLMRAVRNCVEHAGIPLEEALRMASLYPARLMDDKDSGCLEPGFKANVVVFDKSFTPRYVFLNGQLI